jgi:uncharacterized membrane protein
MDHAQFFFRWFHVISGITWIGHLYFFNFVNVPFQAALDDAGKAAANPKLLPRALWWFRWGAMATFLSGLVLYALVFMYDPASGGFAAVGARQPTPWIMMGMLFGAIMWFNVWFIIWPINRKIAHKEIAGDAVAPARRKAYLASRTNTYLSGPMLFGMLGSTHASMQGLGGLGVALVVGLLGIWVAIAHSTRVGTSW